MCADGGTHLRGGRGSSGALLGALRRRQRCCAARRAYAEPPCAKRRFRKAARPPRPRRRLTAAARAAMTSSEWSECFKQLQAGTSTGRKVRRNALHLRAASPADERVRLVSGGRQASAEPAGCRQSWRAGRCHAAPPELAERRVATPHGGKRAAALTASFAALVLPLTPATWLAGTWAGLADAIATYVGSELVSNKGRKTALANTVSSLFRKCIRKAEESARVAGALLCATPPRSRACRALLSDPPLRTHAHTWSPHATPRASQPWATRCCRARLRCLSTCSRPWPRARPQRS